MKISDTEEQTAQALQAALREVPFVSNIEIEQESDIAAGRPDFVLRVKTPAGTQTLLIEVKSSGQPR